MFYTEACNAYIQAHSQARKIVNDFQKVSANPYLIDMDDEVDESDIVHIEDLGLIDIPVRQIVGAAFDYSDINYTFDFKPLVSPDSDYAEEWRKTYQVHLSVRGLSDPIECIECLGRFYVVDGKKRVSVFKIHGDVTTKARVTRWIPNLNKTNFDKQYERFLKSYQITGLYQVFLSNPEDYEVLQKAMGLAPDQVWSEMDRYHFMFTFIGVERAYLSVFGEYASMTAADVFIDLLKKYSFNQIRGMLPWQLSEEMTAMLPPSYDLTDIVQTS